LDNVSRRRYTLYIKIYYYYYYYYYLMRFTSRPSEVFSRCTSHYTRVVYYLILIIYKPIYYALIIKTLFEMHFLQGFCLTFETRLYYKIIILLLLLDIIIYHNHCDTTSNMRIFYIKSYESHFVNFSCILCHTPTESYVFHRSLIFILDEYLNLFDK